MIQTKYIEDYVYEASNEKGHKVVIDMRDGEEKNGLNAPELLLSALAGCVIVDLVSPRLAAVFSTKASGRITFENDEEPFTKARIRTLTVALSGSSTWYLISISVVPSRIATETI